MKHLETKYRVFAGMMNKPAVQNDCKQAFFVGAIATLNLLYKADDPEKILEEMKKEINLFITNSCNYK